jgi:LEA14-like dessication related protein
MLSIWRKRRIFFGKEHAMKATRYIILAAVSALVLSAGCDTLQNMQKPKASLKGVKLADISLESASLLFDVEIANPYSVDLPMVNVDYGVVSNANKLFSGKADITGIVPANSTKMISLPAKVSYMDVARAFKGVSPGSKIPYQADVGLSVNAPVLGVIRLPLNKTGELDVPAIPKASDIEKMLLDKVKQ